MSKKIQTRGDAEVVWSNDKYHKAIIKSLERITEGGGHKPGQIFEDWLSITEATLRMLPVHVEHVAQHGTMAEDDEETKELWQQIKNRYEDRAWPHFQEAFRVLLDSTDGGGCVNYYDLVGNLYMDWGNPDKYNGQFFTSWEIASFMARQIIGTEAEASRQVFDRLRAAIARSPLAEAFMAATAVVDQALESDTALEMLATRILPMCIDQYEPVTVQDPACGSGVMLLAAASVYPEWIVRLGLVRFYGLDIDQTCVKMARINLMLYGLNGYGIRLATGGMQLEKAYRKRFGRDVVSQVPPTASEDICLAVPQQEPQTMGVDDSSELHTMAQRHESIVITEGQVEEQLGLFGGDPRLHRTRKRGRRR